MHGFGGQPVGNVNHGGGNHILLAQQPDDIQTRLRLELAFKNIIVTVQIWLCLRVFQKDLLFPFQNQKAGISRSQIP